jgi:uncharacterized protein (DUF305 family)
MTRLTAIAAALALLAGAATAQDTSPQPAPQAAVEDSMLNMLTMRPGAEVSEADRGYVKAMQTMQQTLLKTEMTGDPSGDFLRMMIPHHQSAIAMVDVLLQQNDIDPDVKKMAEKMKAAQAKEIAEMQKRLETSGK